MSASLLWLLAFVVLLFLGLPVSVAIGLAACLAILIAQPFLLNTVPSMMVGSLDSFLLVAIPLFMLAGNLMERGGASRRIFDFASSVSGWMKGGLGAVNVVASMIFGGISGSSVADAAGLGPIEINAMTARGYPKDYSAAITVASSTLAVVIPPSILMVIYAIAANQSVGGCLLAGLLPGITIGLGMILCNYVISRRHGWGADVPFSFRNILREGRRSFWALLTPLVLLFGVLSGFFTPTEAAGVSVLYVLIISILIYREMRGREILSVLRQVVSGIGSAVLIVCTASLAAYLLTVEKVPQQVAFFLVETVKKPWLILLVINLFLLVVGMFMDATSAVIILTPLLLPVIRSIGMSPIHFGVMMVANLAIGLVTPPVGVCLFVTCSVARISMEDLTRAVLPFYLSLIASLLLITYLPWLSLALPRLFGF